MTALFVSYRRDDTQGFAGRLVGDLETAFGTDQVFSDIEIPIGSDFAQVLVETVTQCDAVLVVIGKRWAGESTAGLPSRLFEAGDWVRIEVEAALDQGKAVVPVLVGGQPMPAAADLPTGLQRLPRRQAAVLSERHWDEDVDQLCARLVTLVPSLRRISAPAPGAPPTALPSAAPQAPRAPGVWRSAGRSMAHAVGRVLRRGLKRLFVIALVLALVVGGIRLFGDASTLRQLDRLEARLLIGWDRLQHALRGVAGLR